MLASCLSCAAIASATAARADSAIYRYEDAQGIAVFADRPRPGRREVTVPAANTYSPLESREPVAAPAETDTAGTYRSLRITGPTDGETIRRNGGNVRVTARIQPDLRQEHHAVLFMDGSRVASDRAPRRGYPSQPHGDIDFSLTGVARGPHTLRIAVMDHKNSILVQSAPVGFHLLRAAAGRHRAGSPPGTLPGTPMPR